MATRKLTEQAFFEQCDEAHRAFFGDLVTRWRKAGREVEMQSSSAVLKTGKVALCSLYPSYRKKGGAVRFNLTSLRKSLGAKKADHLAAEVRAIGGLKAGSGVKELVVQRPAESGLDTHEMFKQVVLGR